MLGGAGEKVNADAWHASDRFDAPEIGLLN
jgi:hypothetical protein